MVPRLVVRLHATYDGEGTRCLDNVDVNGILVASPRLGWFLLGIINAPVTNFIWRRTSKPFQNDFRAANKQFIAPLPVPDASPADREAVGEHARVLTELHTRRAELVRKLDRRLESEQCEDDIRDEGWLWAEVKPAEALRAEASDGLTTAEARRWAKDERERRLAHRLAGLDTMLAAGVSLSVTCEDGELGVMANEIPAIAGVFLNDDEAAFVAAQWRHKVRQINVTEKFDGKRLTRQLLALRKTANDALRRQVIELDTELQDLDREIDDAERAMNAIVYRLYGLTAEEIRLVEEA
jgi:hypothetical protein